MAVGASFADLAVILVDASQGVLDPDQETHADLFPDGDQAFRVCHQ